MTSEELKIIENEKINQRPRILITEALYGGAAQT